MYSLPGLPQPYGIRVSRMGPSHSHPYPQWFWWSVTLEILARWAPGGVLLGAHRLSPQDRSCCSAQTASGTKPLVSWAAPDVLCSYIPRSLALPGHIAEVHKLWLGLGPEPSCHSSGLLSPTGFPDVTLAGGFSASLQPGVSRILELALG